MDENHKLSQTEDCNIQKCGEYEAQNSEIYVYLVPKFNNWSNWSSCSATCGTGQRSQTRRCTDACDLIDPYDPLQVLVMEEGCYLRDCCPTNWSDWSEFSGCFDAGQGPYKKTMKRTRYDHATCKLEGRSTENDYNDVECSKYGNYGTGKCLY